jgi:hypothetical protein
MGSSSLLRSASQRSRAWVRHLGQCRLPQELLSDFSIFADQAIRDVGAVAAPGTTVQVAAERRRAALLDGVENP